MIITANIRAKTAIRRAGATGLGATTGTITTFVRAHPAIPRAARTALGGAADTITTLVRTGAAIDRTARAALAVAALSIATARATTAIRRARATSFGHTARSIAAGIRTPTTIHGAFIARFGQAAHAIAADVGTRSAVDGTADTAFETRALTITTLWADSAVDGTHDAALRGTADSVPTQVRASAAIFRTPFAGLGITAYVVPALERTVTTIYWTKRAIFFRGARSVTTARTDTTISGTARAVFGSRTLPVAAHPLARSTVLRARVTRFTPLANPITALLWAWSAIGRTRFAILKGGLTLPVAAIHPRITIAVNLCFDVGVLRGAVCGTVGLGLVGVTDPIPAQVEAGAAIHLTLIASLRLRADPVSASFDSFCATT